MRRRATMARSSGSATRTKMDACAFLVLLVAGSAVGFNVRREAPYNIGPNDPYAIAVNPNYPNQEPSQRLFWSNQGSNQVGGTGWWASLTNKFPILGNMFGRMELPTQYGVPSTQYGVPGYQTQYEQQASQFYQQPPQNNQQPQQFYQQPQQFYQQPQQFYQQPQQFYQQPQQSYQTPQQLGQRFVPSGRDVGFTDDAVIVTPPFVPVSQPQPAPAPIDPNPGYQYNKPQYRLELPHK